MATGQIVLTGTTCGAMCWYAAEDDCHCSCGGANHGVLRTADGKQPVRTCQSKGHMYRLTVVGSSYKDVRHWDGLGTVSGLCSTWNYKSPLETERRMLTTCNGDSGHPTIDRIASAAEVAKWPELTAYRDQRNRPRLLWVRADVLDKLEGKDVEANA